MKYQSLKMNIVNDSSGTSKIEAGVNLAMTAARHICLCCIYFTVISFRF